jgi:hypothetical protein
MKWFFKWLRNGINNVDKDSREEEVVRADRGMVGLAINKPSRRTAGVPLTLKSDSDRVNLNQQPLNFRIYQATGGHIVEYTFYNEKKDSNDQALHLIPSDLDLGEELAKIMTLEALKR